MSPQSGVSMGHLIRNLVSTYRDNVAFEMGGHALTYRAFGELVFSLARAIDGLGLKRGDGLAVLTANSPECYAVRCASAMLGVRYTPLNSRGAAPAQAAILANAEVSLLIADDAHADVAASAVELSQFPIRIVTLGNAGENLLRLADRESKADFRPLAAADDIDFLAYTGGTTGSPKGVIHPHSASTWASMMWLLSWESRPTPPVLVSSPLSHSGTLMAFPTLLRGGAIHLLARFDPGEVLRSIERHSIDTTLLVPSMIYALLDDPAIATTDLSSFKNLIYGGAPMSPVRLAEGLERFGSVFTQVYGQTEAPNVVARLRREDHDLSNPERLKSCGRPAAGADVRLLRADGQEALDGEGEICIRGGLVMQGYWRNPEATAEAFKDGWLHTGDVARQDDDGFLYIVDRTKDIIISGGFNVYSREVEDCLATHPAVAQSAVIGVPHEKWGEAVKAFVVLRPGMSLETASLIETVKTERGAHMAPKSVEIVETLPLTPVGKIDKPALRRPYWADGDRRVN